MQVSVDVTPRKGLHKASAALREMARISATYAYAKTLGGNLEYRYGCTTRREVLEVNDLVSGLTVDDYLNLFKPTSRERRSNTGWFGHSRSGEEVNNQRVLCFLLAAAIAKSEGR